MVTPDSGENLIHTPSSLTASTSTLSSKATNTMSIIAATIKSKNQVFNFFVFLNSKKKTFLICVKMFLR